MVNTVIVLKVNIGQKTEDSSYWRYGSGIGNR